MKRFFFCRQGEHGKCPVYVGGDKCGCPCHRGER